MKLFGVLPILLFVGLTSSAPVTDDDEKVVIDDTFFLKDLAIYTSEHDIVDLMIPLNGLNFDDNDDTKEDDETATLFFIEADLKENGVKDYKGVYVFKNNKAKKILDNGKDFVATTDSGRSVFFAAEDGIYSYDSKENKAEKYGSLTENLISITKENGTDVIYAINNENQLLKVTENGNKKEIVTEVKNAQKVVTDYQNNIYFYDDKKKVYVLKTDGPKSIAGLPENPLFVKFVRPPFILEEEVILIVDHKAYAIYANGTSEVTDFEFKVIPTASAIEPTFIQFHAYNKKIYEYNLLALMLQGLLESIQELLNEHKDTFESMKTKVKNDIGNSL